MDDKETRIKYFISQEMDYYTVQLRENPDVNLERCQARYAAYKTILEFIENGYKRPKNEW